MKFVSSSFPRGQGSIDTWELDNNLTIKTYIYINERGIWVNDENRELSQYMFEKLNAEYPDVKVAFSVGYWPRIVTEEVYFETIMKILESIDISKIPTDPSMDFKNFR
jgi:ferredoxin-fold anticodon binding domain-containing protein